MRRRVAIVGSTGRVGSALVRHLATDYDVVPISRRDGETVAHLVERATGDVDVVINAAGVAHLDRPHDGDLERLRTANVALPLALAHAALERGAPLLHISSVKAAEPAAASPYAASKREADERLERELGPAFADAGLALVIVRPLALLLPPFDAGKLRWFRFLRWWPRALTPPLRMPILTPRTFVGTTADLVDAILCGDVPQGCHYHQFLLDDRGTMRDVREAVAARSSP